MRFPYCFVLAPALLAAIAHGGDKVKIGLIGDSTVASTYGWGPSLAKKCSEEATVLNYAKNGATLDSLSKKLDALLKKKPDYVLIQFGHNDMKRYDAKAYGAKLKDYVDRIKRAGGKAIVLSSVTRRTFDEHGKIKPAVINGRTLAEFAQAAKAVASECKVPFIDLNTISIKHHNKMGAEVVATYNFKGTDRTHFSHKGADVVAYLVIRELKTAAPKLAEYLK